MSPSYICLYNPTEMFSRQIDCGVAGQGSVWACLLLLIQAHQLKRMHVWIAEFCIETLGIL